MSQYTRLTDRQTDRQMSTAIPCVYASHSRTVKTGDIEPRRLQRARDCEYSFRLTLVAELYRGRSESTQVLDRTINLKTSSEDADVSEAGCQLIMQRLSRRQSRPMP